MAWLRNRSMRRLAVVAALGLAAITGSGAYGQFGEAAGIAEALQPDYLRRDIVLFDQILNLDEAQRVIIGTLYEDYERAFEAGMEAMQGRYDDMREELSTLDETRVLRMVFLPLEEWGEEKHEMGEQFLENVKVVLTEEQLGQWDSFRRRIVREKTMHLGRLSGESTDLFHVVNEMKLDERMKTQIRPLLDAYEMALHQALELRNEAIGRINHTMIEAMMDQDVEKSTREMARQIEMRKAVRRVNDEYRERIAEALPADLGANFRARALERAYPRIYRTTPIEMLFKAAVELPDLDPAVRQMVVGIEASYRAALEPANQALLEAVNAYEPADLLARTEQFHRRMAGQNAQAIADPTRDLFVQRDEIGRSFVEQLQSVLPVERLQELPGIHRFITLPPAEMPAIDKQAYLDELAKQAAEAEAAKNSGEASGKPKGPPE